MMRVLKLLSALLLLSFLPPGLSHVVNKFSDETDCINFFLEEETPNIPGILFENGNSKDQNRYKLICQFFNNAYRFATLYDTTNKIPVFSAYIYNGPGKKSSINGRPKWMIEPQLEDQNGQKSMTVNKSKTFTKQAADMEYEGHNKSINRGHLFPFCYAPDDEAKISTNTLTNAVPQAALFNCGPWRKMEGRLKKRLEDECKDNNNVIKAHLLTGAVPSNPEVKMKGSSVNIPSFMWTAFCCYSRKLNKWIAEAHWGENKKDGQTQTLTLEGLEKHYSFYKTKMTANIEAKLFHAKCPRDWKSDDVSRRASKRPRTIKKNECDSIC